MEKNNSVQYSFSRIDFNFIFIFYTAPKLVKCEEDDDFVNMFDKMMNETINETKTAVPRSQQIDIVAPVHLRQNKKSYGKYICYDFIFKCDQYICTFNRLFLDNL